MGIENKVKNLILQGILNYDESISVVDQLNSNLSGNSDCYVMVDVSLSKGTVGALKNFLDQGRFTVGDKGVNARIEIDKVFVNKNEDASASNKIFWIVINLKTKKRLELSTLLNEIKGNIEQHCNIYYYGISEVVPHV